MHLYIHIPFCAKRCDYCDFVFFTDLNYKDYYVECLLKEIELLYLKYGNTLKTIYFGGGTPSLLTEKQIYKIMNKLDKTFGISNVLETTIEVNPENADKSKLKAIKKAKINRISMGIQSFNQDVLDNLGRHSDVKTSLIAINNLKEIGFDNFNLDLIFGSSGQNLDNLKKSIDTMISFNPTHISTYSLILQKGTKLYSKFRQNKVVFPDDENIADQFDLIIDILKKNGYFRYEISNFAKKNYESEHNKAYWQCKNTLGLGISSVYRINNKRYINTYSLRKYFESIEENKLPIAKIEKMKKKDLINEEIMMAFRTNRGILINEFYKKYGINFLVKYKKNIDKFSEFNVLKVKKDEKDIRIFLNDNGMNISNFIISDFLI